MDHAVQDYRLVLRDWNDTLNRNLALIDTYFGTACRGRYEDELLASFVAIGEELDQFVREVSVSQGSGVRVRRIAPRLTRLSEDIYSFNVALLRALRDGRVGAVAQDERPGPPGASRRIVRFGDRSTLVRELQTALRAGGHSLAVDGHFGLDTEQALVATQVALGIEERYVAGRQTFDALSIDSAGGTDHS
ncbi:MAG TPA: peptidoglycan-binding domain-containing protein [Nocardioidaceae bacterium]|nr:peptidoglycan-binding domain-containing protein [Nocardioidaceae bacterium]